MRKMARLDRYASIVILISLALFSMAPGGSGSDEPTSQTTITLTVDVAAGRKPISPYIYGLNYAKESFATEIIS